MMEVEWWENYGGRIMVVGVCSGARTGTLSPSTPNFGPLNPN
jgi:hypothetical protein